MNNTYGLIHYCEDVTIVTGDKLTTQLNLFGFNLRPAAPPKKVAP